MSELLIQFDSHQIDLLLLIPISDDKLDSAIIFIMTILEFKLFESFEQLDKILLIPIKHKVKVRVRIQM